MLRHNSDLAKLCSRNSKRGKMVDDGFESRMQRNPKSCSGQRKREAVTWNFQYRRVAWSRLLITHSISMLGWAIILRPHIAFDLLWMHRTNVDIKIMNLRTALCVVFHNPLRMVTSTLSLISKVFDSGSLFIVIWQQPIIRSYIKYCIPALENSAQKLGSWEVDM